ncbi:DUF317 domain-containing protein [Streptomyces sp. SP17KL33]|uniref:DUF317 domain-containing protein n=1 Tax=Streptomyces sp. SP17KL33 TaxID=3002534 RepID=UPI002E77F85A|nr:DUF317 domain-containing protein [Streptomyces sp. SP17KL33]MEE1838069.1 DUF317 domain-containing protein [Streptomyces sp. SP17KL33]
MTPFEAGDRVLVSPRYLAGAGDRLADAIGPLIHLFGWPYEHERASGRIHVDSPDGSIFVSFDPGHPNGQWWTIAHHEPWWEAKFTQQTPIEAIAAVTQTLPQLLGDDRHIERIPLTTTPLAQIADLNHWTREGATFTSPDGHCHLKHIPGEETPWRFRHRVRGGFGTHWYAAFTQDTPERLVAQFFTHLATTTPVERAFGDVPRLVRTLDDALITPVRAAAVNPHVHHAAARLERAVRRR